jgi:hypothetical protein
LPSFMANIAVRDNHPFLTSRLQRRRSWDF